MSQVALITGIAGQDGLLLARSLLADGLNVVGTVRDAHRALPVCRAYAPAATIVEMDVRNTSGFRALLEKYRPREIYNLAAWSSVSGSWNAPFEVAEINALSLLGLLEEVLRLRRIDGYDPRILQASSSEMFGLVERLPLNESSAHHPRSPYATAKSFAHHTAVNYRESYGMDVRTAILFNHESPLRPQAFVTRKVTAGVASIALGLSDGLKLGNLDVSRDWGAASEYVQAMRLAARVESPDDYCISTGSSHSLAQFVEYAFEFVGIADGLQFVEIDETLVRPADVPVTLGDSSKAAGKLGWVAHRTLPDLISEMVTADLARLKSGVEHDPGYLREG